LARTPTSSAAFTFASIENAHSQSNAGLLEELTRERRGYLPLLTEARKFLSGMT